MKKVLVVICIVMVLCQCGCRGFFLNEEKESETKGFVIEEIDVESENPVLYSKIAVIDNTAKYPELMIYDESYAKYGSSGVALIWKLERNSNGNEKIHVIVNAVSLNLSDEEIITEIERLITELNSEKDMEINTNEWEYLGYSRFYCMLTENEILSLANQGKLSVDYIGSYMVDSKDLDLTTPEGVDVYIELFGDGYVQCIDGKDIKDYTK